MKDLTRLGPVCWFDIGLKWAKMTACKGNWLFLVNRYCLYAQQPLDAARSNSFERYDAE